MSGTPSNEGKALAEARLQQQRELKNTQRQAWGKAGEEAAAVFLRNKGWVIVARNWRNGSYELDLICREGKTLVFVEVRTRSATGMVSPLQSVTPTKCRRMLKAARLYLAATRAWDAPCRFDLVCIQHDTNTTLDLEHHCNVIDFSQTLGCGNTSWQPW